MPLHTFVINQNLKLDRGS